MTMAAKRLAVAKTYKIYIGGKFPRTESGRYFSFEDKQGNVVANMCRGSRKDFRNSVVAARKAQPGWAKASAYLRSQILYRIAEMLEGRRDQFIAELQLQGAAARAAEKKSICLSID
jgi:acyl-CoA reductase-like NAD-dependent aldehyde dehydrogenase